MYLLLIGLAGAALSAPSNYDATAAIQHRVTEVSEAAGQFISGQDVSGMVGFPTDVILQRCAYDPARTVIYDNGVTTDLSGHECIIKIWRLGEVPYQTYGFFHHNGYDWRYYGAVREVPVPMAGSLGEANARDRRILKNGALDWGGDANKFYNDVPSPYEDLLRDLGIGGHSTLGPN